MSQTNTTESLGGVKGIQEPPLMGNAMGAAGATPASEGIIPPTDHANTAGTQGQQNAPDFITVVRKAASATAMSSDGIKYVRTLKEYIEDKGDSNIKIVPLSYPYESLGIVRGNDGFILIFSEANRREENLPTAAFTKAASQTLHSVMGDNVAVRNCIVVTPQDYTKPEVMGAHLLNALDAVSSNDIRSLNITSMDKVQLELSTNAQNYDDFIRRCDPHGVPARADLKLTISLNVPRRKTGNFNIWDQADIDKMEIAAIGAYVIFTRSRGLGNYEKFIPEIHISNIVTAIPFEGLLPVILALATDTFIDNQYWKTQFSNLGGANTPNIGTLVPDSTTGAPWRATNLTERDQFISYWCATPILVLDVVEGRARIPGLEMFAFGNDLGASKHIISMYNKFLNGQVIPENSVPAVYIAQEYIGYFQSGASYDDSRWIDYLNMMIHHSQQKTHCDALCSHYNQPQDQLNVIKNFVPDLTLHYINHLVSLNADVLRPTQNVVRNAIKIINGTQTTGTVDTSILLSMGQGFVQNPNSGYYQNVVHSNPFTQVYNHPNLFA